MTTLAQHDNFTAPAANVAHRENMADARRELDCARADYREGNGKQALYHWVRANGCLGIATGIAAMSAASQLPAGAERERLAFGEELIAFWETITSAGAVKRCLCDCAVTK